MYKIKTRVSVYGVLQHTHTDQWDTIYIIT